MAESDKFSEARTELKAKPRSWLVSGVAGFIGSHLLEELLSLNQRVTGLDNLSTGFKKNLDEVRARVGESAWKNFTWIEGDICDPSAVQQAVKGAELVLHQAALGSVPRSIEDPAATNHANVVGFISILRASLQAGAKRFVYASSSSVYGDIEDKIKTESRIGNPLSPYAASKRSDEIYAQAFSSSYKASCIGLRYFNVFGPRQDPFGPYAAVVPRWLDSLETGKQATIFGDGETTRDFCYVANVVQANILAALWEAPVKHDVFNIAVGKTTSLNQLYELLKREMTAIFKIKGTAEPVRAPFRAGDVRHSLADISHAREFGYSPTHSLEDGIGALVRYQEAKLQPSKT